MVPENVLSAKRNRRLLFPTPVAKKNFSFKKVLKIDITDQIATIHTHTIKKLNQMTMHSNV